MGEEYPEGMTYRRGRPEDLPSVIRLINNINYNNGSDFIPGQWLRWMADPDRITLVAEKDGEVIATSCAFRYKGGKYVTAYGGRLHGDFRGKRIYYWLTYHLLKKIYSLWSDAEKTLGVSHHIEYSLGKANSSPMWVFKSAGKRMRWIFTEPMSNIMTSSHVLAQLCDHRPVTRMTDSQQLAHIVQNKHTRDFFFPAGYITLCPEAFKAEELYTDYFWQDYMKVYYSLSANGGDASSMDGLSISTTIPCPKGTRYLIEYYGSVESAVISRHLLAHFISLRQAGIKGNVLFNLVLPIDVNMAELKVILWEKLQFSRKDNIILPIMIEVFDVKATAKL